MLYLKCPSRKQLVSNAVWGWETDVETTSAEAQIHSLVARHTRDAVVRAGGKGLILSVNPAVSDIFGYADDDVLSRSVLLLVDPEERNKLKRILVTTRTKAQSGSDEPQPSHPIRGLTKEGEQLLLDVTALPLSTTGDTEYVLVFRDQSRYDRMRQELEAVKDSYWALSETTTDAILQIREDFQILYANSAVQSVLGYSSRELITQDFHILFPSSAYSRYRDIFRKYFVIDDLHRKASKLRNTLEVLGTTKDGEILPLEISFGNSKDVDSQRILTCIIRDITQRKKIERKLRYLAYHDKLTDLGNRDLFHLTLNQFLSEAKRHPDTIGAVCFLDLDGFKRVNDTLGHDVGDKILCECARRLNDCLRESDQIYRFSKKPESDNHSLEDLFRFGGDEFVVLLTHLNHSTDAAVVAQKIIDEVHKPYVIKGYKSSNKINLGVSVGIALIPDNGLDATTLVRCADVAMYKAKEAGNRYTFFTEDINNKATERLLLEAGVRNAIDNNDFELHYQPLVDRQGVIKGAEALLRWNHRERGAIPPSRFIPIAEDTGMIIPLGDWVFEQACSQLRYWNTKGYPGFFVSINLSVKQFNQDNIVEKIASVVKRKKVNPRNLKIEITESCIVTSPVEARNKMEKIKKMGIRIAIDDFGAGYSSLSYLSEYPVDILKIDQSFVINLHKKNNTKIINTIITLAHSLNLDVVAEGVETLEQLNYLSSKRCNVFQGFYFGKAVAASEIPGLLSRRHLPCEAPDQAGAGGQAEPVTESASL